MNAISSGDKTSITCSIKDILEIQPVVGHEEAVITSNQLEMYNEESNENSLDDAELSIVELVRKSNSMDAEQQEDIKWWEMYELLVKFGEENDENYNVHYNYVVTVTDQTVKRLGRWLSHQRACYKTGSLLQHRIKQFKN